MYFNPMLPFIKKPWNPRQENNINTRLILAYFFKTCQTSDLYDL